MLVIAQIAQHLSVSRGWFDGIRSVASLHCFPLKITSVETLSFCAWNCWGTISKGGVVWDGTGQCDTKKGMACLSGLKCGRSTLVSEKHPVLFVLCQFLYKASGTTRCSALPLVIWVRALSCLHRMTKGELTSGSSKVRRMICRHDERQGRSKRLVT